MNLLRLIAFPDDDVAFQAALDNDIILSSISLADIESIIMPKVREISAKKGSSFLEAARECVLTKKLPNFHEKVITEFLRKFEVWNSDQQKHFRKGENAEKSVSDILKSAFSLRWNRIHIAVARLSNSAAGYDSLHQFISAIRLEGDFVEVSAGSRSDTFPTNKNKSNNNNNHNNNNDNNNNDNINNDDDDDNIMSSSSSNNNNYNHQDYYNDIYQKSGFTTSTSTSQSRSSSGPSSSDSLNNEMINQNSNDNDSKNGNRNPKLTIWIMAMHAAKGLEFDEVILPFWSKGTMMDKELPSERKIAFMSLTRAKERVMISYSKSKKLNNIQRVSTGPSLFVESLLQIPGLKMTHEDVSGVTPSGSLLRQTSLSNTDYKYNDHHSNDINHHSYSNSNDINNNSGNSNNNHKNNNRNNGYKAVANNNYDSLSDLQNKYSNMETNSYIGKYSQSSSTPPNVQILGTAGALLKSRTSSLSSSSSSVDRMSSSLNSDMGDTSIASSFGKTVTSKKDSTNVQTGESISESGSGSGSMGHPYLIGELKDIVLKTRSIKLGNINMKMNSDSDISSSNFQLNTNVGNMLSTTDTLNKIITEKVISNSVKKLKKESVSKDEILKQFPSVSTITAQEIKKLLIDKNNTILKSDLVILFREILKVRFGILKGSIPVSDKDNEKSKKEKEQMTRSISTCTSAQLGEYIIKLIIKKNSL